MAPTLSMAVLIMQPVDTSKRDGYRLLFQYLTTMRLRKNLGPGTGGQEKQVLGSWWGRDQEKGWQRPASPVQEMRGLLLSGLCKSKADYWEGSVCVFIALFTFMKPSGIINMLKVSLILFVIVEQKKEAFSSSSGRDPGLGEDGGPGMSVPWAGMPASDGLPGQVGCGHCLGMVAAPWQTPLPLGGWRDALSWGISCISGPWQPCSELSSSRFRSRRTIHQLPSPGVELQWVRPRCGCLQVGPSVGLPGATHSKGTCKPLVLFPVPSLPRTQPWGPLSDTLGDEKPALATLGSGTNGKRPLPHRNPKWAAARGLQSIGPPRAHFKCYLSWAVLANEAFTLPCPRFLPTTTQRSTPSGLGQDQGLWGESVTWLWLSDCGGGVPRSTPLA